MLIRPGTPGDAQAIAATVAECDRELLATAPAGWAPPALETELEKAHAILQSGDHWARIAEVDGRHVGHVVLAGDYLRRLFVRPAHWGSGVAVVLHREALTEAAAAGVGELHLATPACNARARRFYEREGWYDAGPAEPHLGLEFRTYRRVP